jgi:hypothetical protein
MVRTYLKKRNKPDVSEGAIEEAVRAVQERRLSPTFAASRYGMTHTALHYRIKKSAVVTSAFGRVRLLRVTQVGKFQ